MKVKVLHNNNVISSNVLMASTMYTRIVGLMFRKAPLENSDGLLLMPCNSIHTCFMRYSLDIVFLSKKNEVVKVIRNLKPWRMTFIYFKANKTLELLAGKLPENIKEGDILEVVHV